MHHIRRKRDIQKKETHLPVKFDGITMFCSKKLRNGRSFLQPYPVTRQSSKEQRENSVISRFLKMRIAICDRLNPSRLSISNRCSLCSLCALFLFLFVEGMFAVCALGMGFWCKWILLRSWNVSVRDSTHDTLGLWTSITTSYFFMSVLRIELSARKITWSVGREKQGKP